MTRIGQILQNATPVGHIRLTPPQSPMLRAITGGAATAADVTWFLVTSLVTIASQTVPLILAGQQQQQT